LTLVRTLTIGEVLNELKDEFADITISKIRFLESEGLISPERTDSGYRKFTPQDVERLRYVLRTQRDRYLPLKVIREELDRMDAGEPSELAPPPPPVVSGDDPDEPPAADRPAASDEPVAGRRATVDVDARDATPRPVDEVNGSARAGSGTGYVAPPLEEAADDVSLSISELAQATDLPTTTLRALQEHGILSDNDRFDGDDLRLARTASDLLALGLEPRHLRMYRQFAERESAFYEQIISPLLRQRNPDSRRKAQEQVGELVRAGDTLNRHLLVRELRSLLRP
jgi:DNA-binding transcriptional MerR regulator